MWRDYKMIKERCISCNSERIIDNGHILRCLECGFVDEFRQVEDINDLILTKSQMGITIIL